MYIYILSEVGEVKQNTCNQIKTISNNLIKNNTTNHRITYTNSATKN